MRRNLTLLLFLLVLLIAGQTPLAAVTYGFADQGFHQASIRTVYDSAYEGTALDPLTLTSPCLWSSSQSIVGCPTGPTVYSQSNWWRQNWDNNCGAYYPCTYWVLLMNNEPAFNNCNSGPPEASLPRAEPGAGIMGFTAITGSLGGETFPRAHLVLNLYHPNPCDSGYGIPFLSLMADRDRGNGGRTPGALNPSASSIPSKVRFTARLWDMGLPDCPACTGGDFIQPGKGYLDFALWAVAEWGGKPRMLFVNLIHRNIEYFTPAEDPNSKQPPLPGATGRDFEWNWPIAEDTLNPGADLALFEAEALPSLCNYTLPVLSGTPGEEITYTADLQKLFRCASDRGLFRDRMPATADLPIKTVGWKNEGIGQNGAIWTSVHGMEMIP